MPAPPAPRKQYSAAFKRKVTLAAEAVGNSAAGRRFGVNEGSIRGWRRQKAALFACSGTRRSFRGPKQGAFPDLEEELAAFIKDQRAQHLTVNIELLQQKARELVRGKGILPTDFKASKRWVSRFMTRAGFSLRRRTSISQKLPEQYEERHILSLRKATKFQLGQIGNTDQTPVNLDMPSAFTVHEKGSRQVCVRTTGNEKTRVTVMLGCTADRRKLPPYVVFKRKTLPKNEKFPRSVIVRCQDKGWMDETLVLDWVKSVWCRRPGALLSFPSILVLDAFRCHLVESVKRLLRESGTELIVIPGGIPAVLSVLNQWLLNVKPPHCITQLPRSLLERAFWKAGTLPKKFVAQVPVLYKQVAMTFNIHQLLHLANTVRRMGPLWANSAFTFESGNSQLLQHVSTVKQQNKRANYTK
ncbi:Pogo transposable element with KRAB domain [Ixodes scapularis]